MQADKARFVLPACLAFLVFKDLVEPLYVVMRGQLNLPWDACFHSARHTALTNLGLAGTDPFTLQRAAGHASIGTTRKYVHPTSESLKTAFQKKTKGELSDRRKLGRKRVAKVIEMPEAAAPATAAAGRRGTQDLGTPV